MYGSGVGTGLETTVTRARQTRGGLIPVPIVCYGVAVGAAVAAGLIEGGPVTPRRRIPGVGSHCHARGTGRRQACRARFLRPTGAAALRTAGVKRAIAEGVRPPRKGPAPPAIARCRKPGSCSARAPSDTHNGPEDPSHDPGEWLLFPCTAVAAATALPALAQNTTSAVSGRVSAAACSAATACSTSPRATVAR